MMMHFLMERPFPHAIFDSFLPTTQLAQIKAAFNLVPTDNWVGYDRADESGKQVFFNFDEAPAAIQEYITTMYSPPVIRLLSRITGFDELIGDFTLHGGGLHSTKAGGKLGIHADAEVHPITQMHRRLNVILYCDTLPDAGGALELWAPDLSHCVTRIPVVENRLVLFVTTAHSFHGHPTPATVVRRSVALFYWSPPRRKSRFVRIAGEPFDFELERYRISRSSGNVGP